MKQLIKLLNQLITWLKKLFKKTNQPKKVKYNSTADIAMPNQRQKRNNVLFSLGGYTFNKSYSKVPSIEYRDYKVLIAAYGYKPHQFSFKDYLQYKNKRGPYQTHLRTY